MKITIELLAGNHGTSPSKNDIRKNILAQQRAIDGKSLATDFVPLMDTKSILLAIEKELPE